MASRPLNGRRVLYTDVTEVTSENVLWVLSDLSAGFQSNAEDVRELRNYYRGVQEIRNKVKETRPEINHKICENRFFQIVDFYTGMMCGDPVIYTVRDKDSSSTDAIRDLNRMMQGIGIDAVNKRIFDNMHISGTAYTLVEPEKNPELTGSPVRVTVLDPDRVFYIYSSDYRQEPIAAAYRIQTRNHNGFSDEITTVYTASQRMVIKNGTQIESVNYHGMPVLPVFEWRLNDARTGVPELAVPLLDAINYLDSDRMDSVTQFVNSLVVIYNAVLPDDEDGNTIRQKGLICLDSTGEAKGDIKILSETLDQTQTQTLKEDLYSAVLQIVGMPNQSTGGGTDSSNNGAIFLKQGYQLTEQRAKGEELMFRETARKQLALILYICNNTKGYEIGAGLNDIEITFTRHAYSDIVSKSTVLTTLLNSDYVSRYDAWELSGITPDPEGACMRGMEWHDEKSEADRQVAEAEAEAEALKLQAEQTAQPVEEEQDDGAVQV